MELKWLEDFLSLAATRSFSRSAEQRHVTQPAFSRRIKALELWLGTALVDRSTYPTTLTPAGVAFRSTAESVVEQLGEARSAARGRQTGRDMVSFAALHTLALSFYPSWLRQVEELSGPLATRLMADNLHDCVEALTLGDCDFLLTFTHPNVPLLLNPEQYPHLTLGSDRIVPVCAPDNDGRPLWSLDGDTGVVPYLAYSGDTFLGRLVEWHRGQLGGAAGLEIAYENSMAEALKAMAIERHGVAWLPERSVLDEIGRGRLVRAGSDAWAVVAEVRIVRAAGRRRATAERLWTQLRQNYAGSA